MSLTRYRRSFLPRLFFAAALLAGAGAARAQWAPTLQTNDTNANDLSIAGFDDGTAALAYRVWPTGAEYPVVYLRTYQGGAWSAAQSVPTSNLPTYNGRTAQLIGRPIIGSASRATVGGAPIVLGVQARYSRTYLDSNGLMYAFFIATWNGQCWSPWTRVTGVGIVSDIDMKVDAQGRAHFIYSTGTNIDTGNFKVSSYDTATGVVGATHTLDVAHRTLTWKTTTLNLAPGAVWVTYRASDGLFARRILNNGAGPVDARIPVVPGIYPPAHVAAWADGTLWVLTEDNNLQLRQLANGSFTQVPITGLDTMYVENDNSIESVSYFTPVMAARPEGGLTIATTRWYHYENWDDSSLDNDTGSIVAVERTGSGTWTPRQTLLDGDTWSDIGNAIASSSSRVWVGAVRNGNWGSVWLTSRASQP